MRNPVKTAKQQLLRVGSCALSALMVLGSIPAAAIGDGVTATYDEAYYAMTDYYGNLTDGSVVKSYRTNGIATLTDYGEYDEVINLTDGTAPARNGGMTTFRLDEKALPGTFYFEGKTTKPFQQLPWTISMSYTLNGVPTKAEDLAGQAGVVEIRLDIVPNERASEYARNNYTLEAMAIFNQDDILSLEAPGAQVQLIGNLRAVLFLGLPGEECHYTIRVGSEDFAFGGMTFLMVPATLSQLEEIAKLSERKDDLEDNYNKLSGSIDSLLDAMTAMTGSLNASANGLEQLNKAWGIFSDGKGVIYSGTDALREDLFNLADVLEPVEGQIEALSKTISDSKSVLNSISNTSSDLRDELEDLEYALDRLENTGDLRSVLSACDKLSGSLITLRNALGVTGSAVKKDTEDAVESVQGIGEKTIKQLKAAHSAYAETDRETFYQDMLELSGVDQETAKSLAKVATVAMTAAGENVDAAITALKGQLTALKGLYAAATTEDEKNKLEKQIAGVEAVIQYLPKLEKSYTLKGSMTFQQFCQQVLGLSAAEAKQTADLWLLYASGKLNTDTSGNTTVTGELLHNDPEGESNVAEEVENNGDNSGNVESGGNGDGSGEDNNNVEDNGNDEETNEGEDKSSGTDESDGKDGTGEETEGENKGDGNDPDLRDSPAGSSPGESGSIGGAAVDLIAGGLDNASKQIKELQSKLYATMGKLAQPTGRVVDDLAALCVRLGDLTSMLSKAEDMTSALSGASRELRDILKDAEKLESLLDEYEPTLQDTLKTVSSLSTSAIKTIRDTQGLISDTEALMKSTGATLDDGTKQTLEGLAAVLRSTAKTMGTAGQIKDAKTSICDIIEDTWDEYTGDVNNLLLMDATAEAVSLTDSRNPSPESIQILIRTQEITMPDEDETEAEAAAEVQTTFWGRVAQMFKDFWAAITGLFGGKD